MGVREFVFEMGELVWFMSELFLQNLFGIVLAKEFISLTISCNTFVVSDPTTFDRIGKLFHLKWILFNSKLQLFQTLDVL